MDYLKKRLDSLKEFCAKCYPIVKMVKTVGILFIILLINTYLSRLSLTGDFDGKDIGRITMFRDTLKTLGYTFINKDIDTVSEKSLIKLIDIMQTEVILRDYEKLTVVKYDTLKLDSNYICKNIIDQRDILQREYIIKRYCEYLSEVGNNNNIINLKKSLTSIRFVSSEKLQSQYSRNVNSSIYRLAGLLQKEFKKNLQGVKKTIEDDTLKVDTSNIFKNIFSKEDTLKNKKKSYVIHLWDTTLERMIKLRERTISPEMLSFWPLYIDIVQKYLSDHDNDYAVIFTHILISPALYFVIFLLALYLTFHILIRLWRKFRTAQFTQKIEKHLSPLNQQALQQIFIKFKEKSVGVGALKFTEHLTETKKIPATSFDMILFEDDNETEHFTRTTDFINMWILRLGIIGTLMGIMLAFYEVAKAVPQIEAKLLPLGFKQGIREALTGHAVAVITALAAQTTSIIYEVCCLKWAGISLSKDWLIEQSKQFLDDTKSCACDVNGLCIEMRTALQETIKEIKKLGEKFNTTNYSVANLPDEAQQAVKHLEEINNNLELTKISGTNILNSVNASFSILVSIKNILNKIKDLLESFDECLERKIKDLCGIFKTLCLKLKNIFC